MPSLSVDRMMLCRQSRAERQSRAKEVGTKQEASPRFGGSCSFEQKATTPAPAKKVRAFISTRHKDQKKGILALSSCRLLHLILAGAGDWNKSQQLRLPPKRESIYLHMSQRPKEGDPGSGLLPSSSPHFGKSWRLEQKFTSPTPAKKREHLILP